MTLIDIIGTGIATLIGCIAFLFIWSSFNLSHDAAKWGHSPEHMQARAMLAIADALVGLFMLAVSAGLFLVFR